MDKNFFKEHMSQQFNTELEDIIRQVMAMGGLVEQQLADGIKAMTEGDSDLAQKVMTSDYQINAKEVEIDEGCTHILARRQPTASDLRLVIAVIKTIADLERMGDEAERVGRMGLHLLDEDRNSAPMPDLAQMGENTRSMTRGALDAFARMDVGQAVRVAQQDIHIDSLYETVMHKLMKKMTASPDAVPRLMDIVWATRSLERIGDRARNICEYVVYFVKGKDVRHISYEQMAEEATGDRH